MDLGLRSFTQVVEDPVGHRLVKVAFVAERPEVELSDLSSTQVRPGTYRIVTVAKSGWPVLGHRQVNSGQVNVIV